MNTIQQEKPLAKNEHKSEPKIFGWLASISLLLLILATQLLPQGHNEVLKFVGITLLVCAAAMIFTPLFLQSKMRKVTKEQEIDFSGDVLQHNLYAILRHPQYLGYIMMALGFTCLSQNWVVVCLASLATVFFYFQIVREEEYCLQKFGDEYLHYCRKVPRLNFFKGISIKLKRIKND